MNATMKNREILDTVNTLAEIIRMGEHYPVGFSFALSKNMKALERAAQDFREARDGLLDEYGVKDEDGNPAYKKSGKIEIAPEYEAEWETAVRELLDIPVEIPVHLVEVAALKDTEVSPAVLYGCDFMLKE